MRNSLSEWVGRASRALRESHAVLSLHEGAISRVVVLEDVLKQLSGLPVDIQDYFREAVACLEQGLFRAGVVMSWAGYFAVFSETLYTRHETAIRANRPKWVFKSLDELKELVPEGQILDVAKDVGFVTKSHLRVLQGQLATRNRSAHPTLYKPTLNSAVGFVDEMLTQTIKLL